jgi:hypothetical protein
LFNLERLPEYRSHVQRHVEGGNDHHGDARKLQVLLRREQFDEELPDLPVDVNDEQSE